MQIKDRSSATNGGDVCSHLMNAAVALGGDAQALVIEQASVVADGVPARRPSRRVQLVPFGEFSARDGRPFGMVVQVAGVNGQQVSKTVTARSWKVDNEAGFALMVLLNNRHADGKATFGFDYEHQSIKSATNGKPAPRSGSGSQFEWVWDKGLYITDVNWTPKAAQAILDGEYAYVSPVLFFDPDTGVVFDIFNAALVHTPALQELAGLQVSSADLAARIGLAHQHPLEDTHVTLLEQLIAKLGLPSGTTEAVALSAVVTQADKLKAVGSALNIDPATADVPAITAALSAATTGQAVAVALGAALQLPAEAMADPAKATAVAVDLSAKVMASGTPDAAVRAVAELSSQVAALTKAQVNRDLDALVDRGLAEGKLVPATVPLLKGLGVAGLSSYLQTAPVIAPTQGSAQGNTAHDPASSSAALSADAAAIASQLGVDVASLA